MAELYQELKDADYEAELNMLAYQEWVTIELEKEAHEAYQLNNDEQDALNTYMEGSHAFYNNSNSNINSSNHVLELHSRKRRRKEMLKEVSKVQTRYTSDENGGSKEV